MERKRHVIKFCACSGHRYGRPWGARVDFSKKESGEFIWGETVGGYQGAEAEVIIMAAPGEVIAYGQKDFRNSRNSAASYAYVATDGDWYDAVGIVDAKKKAAAELASMQISGGAADMVCPIA